MLLRTFRTSLPSLRGVGASRSSILFSRFFSSADVVEIGFPALSPTMDQGTIAKWTKSVGDYVNPGDVIAEIETDKAVVAYESVEEGYIGAILTNEGEEGIPVGQIIALLVEEESQIPSAQAAAKNIASTTAAPPPASGPSPATPSAPAPIAGKPSQLAHFSPAVAVMLHTHHIDPHSITPTGKGGRILKGDILAAMHAGTASFTASLEGTAAAPKAAPPSTASSSSSAAQASVSSGKRSVGRGLRTHVDIVPTQMRRVIASRLTQSKCEIPHTYSERHCKIDALLALRSQLKQSLGRAPSLNDFVIKAAALACRDVPIASSTFDPKMQSVKLSETVDISVAVATPTGLITPIVKKADTLNIGQIGAVVKDLAGRAKENKLLPDEFMGGSFTISNLGMFGIDQFSAVINLPQTCILAVAGSQKRANPLEGGAGFETLMSVTLSTDERAVDNAAASQWLESFRGYIEQPKTMML